MGLTADPFDSFLVRIITERKKPYVRARGAPPDYLPHNLGGAIGRMIINDENFKTRIIQGQEQFKAECDVSLLVPGGDDDRHKRKSADDLSYDVLTG